jgi:hypothetical protein
VNESVASAVLSRVADVQTRLSLSRVNKTWHRASKRAPSLPPSLDFSACPLSISLGSGIQYPVTISEAWQRRFSYLLRVEGFLDLPEGRLRDLVKSTLRGVPIFPSDRDGNVKLVDAMVDKMVDALVDLMKIAKDRGAVPVDSVHLDERVRKVGLSDLETRLFLETAGFLYEGFFSCTYDSDSCTYDSDE